MKTMTLNFSDSNAQFEIDTQELDLITLTVRDMTIYQESPGHTVEVYLSYQEVKELIRTLQVSIPLEESE